MTTVRDLAESFARIAHAGQTDKQGRGYADHHLAPVAATARALAESVGMDDDAVEFVEALAWLHDTMEDCGATDADLIEDGLGDCCESVGRLTKPPGVDYQTYISDLVASASIEAVLVKLADNLVNSTTLAALPEETRIRLAAKYRAARPVLMSRVAEYAMRE